ncbi:SDR family NAD(P)-dependent oxidoreductase [Streptomyces antarcticus]|uniref:SDR family NAD(P)-dependent oxidoreductase n=1 Tax=Streptomyces antarcticus TaxID=2996458 RepID=UPI00226DF613|nr:MULTISPECIES: SDR family oxidoreductase [unclassified Streptomyces]MCY0940772.1 SDR family NAD(P)-dependent oxidoreductase [Streptomyces sp. H34-AA3]MCY0953658.1 SDR family NAD(P)-dependent oxidoreductase [Streptomyces sp. H27-S2]MCZ4082972.1 SDR family NAD(P)-dependent oxidoreductase [Streptomyces sp. H34-S5]
MSDTATRTTALITGSSSGIGLDIARAFLASGANVVLNGRDPERLAKAAAGLGRPERTAWVAGSIAEARTGEDLVHTALDRFDSLDVLVNNAGTFSSSPFTEVTEAELDGFLTGNLKGTYLTTQAFVRALRAQGRGGSVVNIGTVLVDHAVAGFPASAPVVSKAGVHALTTALSAELAADGIRVNLVAPGIVRTPLHSGSDVDSFGGIALLGRVAEVSEISEAVLYLAGAEFVTGHALRVDGGYVTGRS